ncbi:hypothetical protein M5K25_005043 [Dendrobium thyrsiflorum]|uniref:Uncharacterized protein n=1 Tax=Dendrobium thyrsiflorum TaxID=117978 RepID=A0ABD0VGE2_DENTH
MYSAFMVHSKVKVQQVLERLILISNRGSLVSCCCLLYYYVILVVLCDLCENSRAKNKEFEGIVAHYVPSDINIMLKLKHFITHQIMESIDITV